MKYKYKRLCYNNDMKECYDDSCQSAHHYGYINEAIFQSFNQDKSESKPDQEND